MKERHVNMRDWEVRAIQDCRKMQLRRVIDRLTGVGHVTEFHRSEELENFGDFTFRDRRKRWHSLTEADVLSRCPFGKPGDRLWVREPWRTTAELDSLSGSEIAVQCIDAEYRKPWAPILYEADGCTRNWHAWDDSPKPGRYRHGIFMPRWASRITLEITNVRVERLQDISEADAHAEGIAHAKHGGLTAQDGFRNLWESMYMQGAWAANPWVWVIEFKRI